MSRWSCPGASTLPLPLQIPKTAAEPEILAVFAPYGEVEQVNILKSKGVHAGAPPAARAGAGGRPSSAGVCWGEAAGPVAAFSR